MTIGSSAHVKNQVRDSIEHGFDTMHRVADTVTFPLAAVDGAIHGVARGVLNWLTDTHPEDRKKKKCKPGHVTPPPNTYYFAPAPPPPPPSAYGQPYPYVYNYGYPPAPPPPPPGPPQPSPQYQTNPGYLSTPHPSNGNHPGQC